MKRILVVVDMQKDFVDGALGTKEAVSIVEKVVRKIQQFDGEVIYTRDTHGEDYMDTQEGNNLPVPHCIRGTDGWELDARVESVRKSGDKVFDKPAFGSKELAQYLSDVEAQEGIESIMLVGLCTDICVISNALLIKAFLPEVQVLVDASCCAGVTPKSHDNALEAMKMCQISIEHERK